MSENYLWLNQGESLQEREYNALLRKVMSSIAIEEMIIEENEDGIVNVGSNDYKERSCRK